MKTAKVTTVTTIESTQLAKELDATNALGLMQEFNSIKETIKTLKLAQAEIDSQLREVLGDAQVGTIEGVERLRLVTRGRTGTDMEMLKNLYTEAWLATQTSSSYDFLQTV